MCHETFDQTIQITMEYNERDVSDDEEIVVEDNNNEDEEPGDELEEEENDKPEENKDKKVVLNCKRFTGVQSFHVQNKNMQMTVPLC